MAFFSSFKFAGAIAAGAVALGLSIAAPAQASSITFKFDYTGGSNLNVTSLSSFITVSDNAALSTAAYTAYTIDYIVGTRSTTGTTTKTKTITGLATTSPDTNFVFDNILFVNNTTGLAALDDQGIAFFTSDGNEFNVYYSDGTFSTGGFTFPYDGYIESVSTGNDAGVRLTITQVPAPTALALLGMSLVGMGLVRRRRNV